MIKVKITEIFRSIQGEGPYAGVLQVFVRFLECNMACAWCDTPTSKKGDATKYMEYSPKDLLKEVKALVKKCHSISLTGGEPLLQKDFLKEFLPLLKKEKFLVYLETNGICYQALAEVISGVDIISMDIKLPSSTKERAYWQEHEEFLKLASRKEVFVKSIISKETTVEDILKAVNLVTDIDPNILFILQPNSLELDKELIELCVTFQKKCLNRLKSVRIIPQMHKMLGVK